jgi:hypothetical protein
MFSILEGRNVGLPRRLRQTRDLRLFFRDSRQALLRQKAAPQAKVISSRHHETDEAVGLYKTRIRCHGIIIHYQRF